MKKENTVMMIISFFMAISIFIFSNITESKKQVPKEEKIEEPVALYGTVEYVKATGMKEWKADENFIPVDCVLDMNVQEFTYFISSGYDMDFYLVMALMEHESEFDANAISSSGDWGLMQINKCNHEWISEELGTTDFLDPYQNIIAGTYVLHGLFEKYGDTSKVLMAYNMGESGARSLWNQGIYETTYSREIMNRTAEMKGGVE